VLRVQIQQVVVNLVANALRSFRDSSEASVFISAARWGQQAVVSISDRGPGVPPARREDVFEPGLVERPEGTGLGLYISRLIVSGHGGRIWIDDYPGGGSIFRFALPLDGGAGG
jgi:two-component system sensor kinase FixL